VRRVGRKPEAKPCTEEHESASAPGVVRVKGRASWVSRPRTVKPVTIKGSSGTRAGVGGKRLCQSGETCPGVDGAPWGFDGQGRKVDG
jgi:hypothetical protein